MLIEASIAGHTDCFSLILTEDNAFCFLGSRQLQHIAHFLICHEGCRTVHTRITCGKAPWIFLLTVESVVQLIDEKYHSAYR